MFLKFVIVCKQINKYLVLFFQPLYIHSLFPVYLQCSNIVLEQAYKFAGFNPEKERKAL